MVSQLQARRDIYQRFLTLWPPALGVVFTFDNEVFVPPDSDPWIRFSVRHDGSALEAIGGTTGGGGFNKYQRTGRAVLQVFTALNKGAAEADTIVDEIRDIFEGVALGGNTIRFTNVVAREIGPDGQWYQVNVEAAFQYDDRR